MFNSRSFRRARTCSLWSRTPRVLTRNRTMPSLKHSHMFSELQWPRERIQITNKPSVQPSLVLVTRVPERSQLRFPGMLWSPSTPDVGCRNIARSYFSVSLLPQIFSWDICTSGYYISFQPKQFLCHMYDPICDNELTYITNTTNTFTRRFGTQRLSRFPRHEKVSWDRPIRAPFSKRGHSNEPVRWGFD